MSFDPYAELAYAPIDAETWRPVVGYEAGYSVSSRGRVWSQHKQGLKVPSLGTNGYLQMVLHRNGKGTNRRVHRLVAEAFLGPCPAGMECCHKDADRLNNEISNLRWDTNRANMAEVFGSYEEPFELYPIERKCVMCDKSYTPHVNHRGRSVVCSEKCRSARKGQHGRQVAATASWKGAKLTPVQVREIKGLLAAGASGGALARKYGVSRSMIFSIKKGGSWGWLPESEDVQVDLNALGEEA